MSTVRRVCRNVKRWRSASMALRWTAAAMEEAAKGFRRLKAHRATSGTPCRSASTSNEKLNSRRPCSSSQRRVTSTSATAAPQCSTKSGTSPGFGQIRELIVNFNASSSAPLRQIEGFSSRRISDQACGRNACLPGEKKTYDGDGEFVRFFASARKADRNCNIEPPAPPYAIMRRAYPYRERTVGPARISLESLTPRPGIREQNLPIGEIGPYQRI